jgi:hypothetical protein
MGYLPPPYHLHPFRSACHPCSLPCSGAPPPPRQSQATNQGENIVLGYADVARAVDAFYEGQAAYVYGQPFPATALFKTVGLFTQVSFLKGLLRKSWCGGACGEEGALAAHLC